jgi:hypothetical protein
MYGLGGAAIESLVMRTRTRTSHRFKEVAINKTMTSTKRKRATIKPRRRWREHLLRTLPVILIAAVLATVLARWRSHEGRPTYRTLPEVLASGNYGGFDVVQRPDRPGPYESMGPVCAGKGEPVSGSFWAHGKTRRFNLPGVPGKEFCVLGLIPRDGGEPTYVVLSRQTAPVPPVGQPTK